jgi:hypothetical protein
VKYRITNDRTGEFKFLVEYKVTMTCLDKWFVYARCNTQESADTRYDAMVKGRA